MRRRISGHHGRTPWHGEFRWATRGCGLHSQAGAIVPIVERSRPMNSCGAGTGFTNPENSARDRTGSTWAMAAFSVPVLRIPGAVAIVQSNYWTVLLTGPSGRFTGM